MGPLVGKDQVTEVSARVGDLLRSSEMVFEYANEFKKNGHSIENGAFFRPTLLHCSKPLSSNEPHDIEAFGPVSTVMGYENLDEAIELVRRGKR